MCQCSTPCSCDSEVDLPYLNGDNGLNGLYGGFSSKWTFKTETTPTPVTSTIRLNNATFASVTEIYVDSLNTDSVNMDDFIDYFSTFTNYGLIKLFKEYDSSKFWAGRITNVVDNGGDHTITVTHIKSSGSFALNDSIVLTFTPIGENGDPGTNGDNLGFVVESYSDDPSVETIADGVTGVFTTDLTIPANEIVNDEDVSKFQIHIENGASGTTSSSRFNVRIAGTTEATVFINPTNKVYIYGEIQGTKHFFITSELYNASGTLISKTYVEGHSTGIVDFTTNNVIDVNVVGNNGGLTLNKMHLEILKLNP
jgi:hypothetical protein